MPTELERFHCPHCAKEVDAVRPASGGLATYIFFGWLGLLLAEPKPWQCRECGADVTPPVSHRRQKMLTSLVVTFLLMLVAIVALGWLLPALKR